MKPVTVLKRAFLELPPALLPADRNRAGMKLGRHLLDRLDQAGYHVVERRTTREAYAAIVDLSQHLARLLAESRGAGLDGAPVADAELLLKWSGFRYCRCCGCSEHDACDPPCSWVEADLCSGCVEVQSSS